MNNKKILEHKATALRTKIAQLQADERNINRVAGVQKEITKANVNAEALEAEAAKWKAKAKDLRGDKARALSNSLSKIQFNMGTMLSVGSAAVEIADNGGITFGWDLPGQGVIQYGGLSGGQKVQFDAALAYALTVGAKLPVVIVEGAEVGGEIDRLLDRLTTSNPEAQIFVNTCFPVAVAPEPWMMHRLGGKVHAGS